MIVCGAVDGAAVNLPAAGAAEVVTVDFLLVDFMQDCNLAAVKAELLANPIQGLIIGHVAGGPAIDALGQLRIFGLGDVLRELVGLPFQLPVKLGLEESQPALILRAALLEGLIQIQDFAVQPLNLGGAGLIDFLFAVTIDKSLAESVFITVETAIGLFDFGVLGGHRLEAGALHKFGQHHFRVPP